MNDRRSDLPATESGPQPADAPSRTAQGAALLRAAHQVLERPVVFEDPIALQIIGAEIAGQIALDSDLYRTPWRVSLRAFLVARSRYAEEELARAFEHGTRQYVVLGAGMDTFAYRNPHGAQLRVFEVDHPRTQAGKRTRLQAQGIALPPWLVFVPVDFEKDSLAERLRAAGFDAAAPAFLSWLGVSMYLTRDAVMQTLRFVALGCARGSQIVFDYSVPDDALGESERAARARLGGRVAGIGEPFLSHFDPASLARELVALGFSATSDFGAQEANERYFTNRTDGFSVRGSTRIMTARV